MARWFRFYGKKRGHRRTGSEQAAWASEALLSAGLLLVGVVGAVTLLVWRILPQWQADHWVWLLLLVPLPFVSIGGGGLIRALLHWQTSTERRAALAKRASELGPFEDSAATPKDFPAVPKASNLTNSPGTRLSYRLPITSRSSWKLFGTATFCIVWNGIVGLFVVLAVGWHLRGSPDWWLDVVLVPFGLFGLWAIVGLVRQVMDTTGVGPTWVEISDHPLMPGKSYELLVCQSGRLNVRWLDVKLVCVERASYHQGTDVRTEIRTVCEQPVLRCEDLTINPAHPFEQPCQLEIPSGAMHSFHSEFNEINWSLLIEGVAEGWPPFTRSFPVIVYPAPGGGRQA